MEVYDTIMGGWRDAEVMSMLRSRVGMAVMQLGGYNGQERLNTTTKTKDEARWQR